MVKALFGVLFPFIMDSDRLSFYLYRFPQLTKFEKQLKNNTMETLTLPVQLLELLSQKAEERQMSITDLLYDLVNDSNENYSDLESQILMAQTQY